MDSAALQDFLDKEQIRELMTRYFVGVDRRDWAMIRDCFAQDCTAEYHAFKSPNLDSLMKSIMGVASARVSMHFMGNQLIEVHGDTAKSETYCLINMLRAMPGESERNTIFGARYVDQLVRLGGQWKIKRRDQYRDFGIKEESVPQPLRVR